MSLEHLGNAAAEGANALTVELGFGNTLKLDRRCVSEEQMEKFVSYVAEMLALLG